MLARARHLNVGAAIMRIDDGADEIITVPKRDDRRVVEHRAAWDLTANPGGDQQLLFGVTRAVDLQHSEHLQ